MPHERGRHQTGLGTGDAARSRLLRLWGSSVGLKLIMALTGVILSGFVLGHMVGQPQVFQGAEALDAYGKLLHKEPAILWRPGPSLLGAVGLHIWAYLRPDPEEPEGAGAGRTGGRSTGSRASPRGRCG